MTKEELIAKLRVFSNDDDARDPENDHETADRLLLEFIDDDEVTEAFVSFEKWYS